MTWKHYRIPSTKRIRRCSKKEKTIDRHNARTNVQSENLHLGDLVMVRRAKSTGQKLGFEWVGPRRITAVKSALVFDVQNLISHKKETAHARRLRLYRADMEGIAVLPELMKTAQHLERTYQLVEKVVDIRKT